eukprot:gnl/TRDRNA2_/TRDRNA2_75082_c0_seq2.p1 gnl/TRDRNA2_/TRDRNA2_75082_c0~~gnl/TRDRNA2_/TRDRNA2_75082_c0_seq2.p1  ORF type:complete len:174 (+),score=21.29 gnl/TRDRNA2_/TRDRNA2_75082_c0_seq2:120-641(+)
MCFNCYGLGALHWFYIVSGSLQFLDGLCWFVITCEHRYRLWIDVGQDFQCDEQAQFQTYSSAISSVSVGLWLLLFGVLPKVRAINVYPSSALCKVLAVPYLVWICASSILMLSTNAVPGKKFPVWLCMSGIPSAVLFGVAAQVHKEPWDHGLRLDSLEGSADEHEDVEDDEEP